jgi:hypothetical protein
MRLMRSVSDEPGFNRISAFTVRAPIRFTDTMYAPGGSESITAVPASDVCAAAILLSKQPIASGRKTVTLTLLSGVSMLSLVTTSTTRRVWIVRTASASCCRPSDTWPAPPCITSAAGGSALCLPPPQDVKVGSTILMSIKRRIISTRRNRGISPGERAGGDQASNARRISCRTAGPLSFRRLPLSRMCL